MLPYATLFRRRCHCYAFAADFAAAFHAAFTMIRRYADAAFDVCHAFDSVTLPSLSAFDADASRHYDFLRFISFA